MFPFPCCYLLTSGLVVLVVYVSEVGDLFVKKSVYGGRGENSQPDTEHQR